MKLRLDEYYWCAADYWDYIDEYMPKELADKMHQIEKTDNESYDSTIKFLEETYSHLKVIDKELVNVNQGYPEYRIIINLNDKYYSFYYVENDRAPFSESFNMEQELVEVHPKNKTITVYE